MKKIVGLPVWPLKVSKFKSCGHRLWILWAKKLVFTYATVVKLI